MSPMIEGILIIVLFCIDSGNSLQCYECSTDIEYGSNDVCSAGKGWYLRRVQCRVPSVCATYSFTTLNKGRPSITTVTRGCQAIQYGSTCEDIFNDLRSRGSFHQGHHECSTCSTDFCNSSVTNKSSYCIHLVSLFVLCILNYVYKLAFR